LPEFTDELAKEFKYESIDDFNAKTRSKLISQKERQTIEKLHQDILEKLVDENSFDVPVALVDRQKEFIKEDVERSLKQQGFNDKMLEEYFEKWKEDLDKKAHFQVRSGLILDKLAMDYNIETSDSDFETKIEETAKLSGIDKEQIIKYYSDEKIKNNLMYAIREEKTFEKLKENIKIS